MDLDCDCGLWMCITVSFMPLTESDSVSEGVDQLVQAGQVWCGVRRFMSRDCVLQ